MVCHIWLEGGGSGGDPDNAAVHYSYQGIFKWLLCFDHIQLSERTSAILRITQRTLFGNCKLAGNDIIRDHLNITGEETHYSFRKCEQALYT